jgi:hypothetical protein
MERQLSPALVLCLLLSAACGSDTIAPSPQPQPQRFTVSGTVTETPPTQGRVIAGARVAVEDGPDAGVSATSDAQGRYALPDLRESTISLRATAPGYEPRTGTIVLSSHRELHLQLDPVNEVITETVTATIQPCNGEDYIVCFAHRFYAHHRGPVSATVTTGPGNHLLEIQLYEVDRPAIWLGFTRRSGTTETFNFCSGCPPGTWDFRIVGRIPEPVPLTVVLTRPN